MKQVMDAAGKAAQQYGPKALKFAVDVAYNTAVCVAAGAASRTILARISPTTVEVYDIETKPRRWWQWRKP